MHDIIKGIWNSREIEGTVKTLTIKRTSLGELFMVVVVDNVGEPEIKSTTGGHVLESLDLSVRRWRCPSCQSENDRDENASLNIKKVGSSTLGVGDVRQSQTAISV